MGYIEKYFKDLKKEEKNALSLEDSYCYWKDKLFEKCMRIFEWEGLPFEQKEIESRLILYGYCGYVKDNKIGEMVANGSLSGVTQYSDEFTKFTYSAPTAEGGTKTIGEECVIISNDSLRNNLYDLICRTASLLAHSEITLKCALVNMRANTTYGASDDATVSNITTWYNKLYEGHMYAINIDDTSTLINNESVVNLMKNSQTSVSPLQAIECRNEILRAFYSEIGIRFSKEKRGNMTDDEVNTDSQMLLINIDDMLKFRINACKEINKIFKKNVSVKLNSKYSEFLEGVQDNDN